MPDDYIKRIDALFELYRYASARDPVLKISYRVDLCERIEKIPAADVEPKRKTGRWSVIEGKIKHNIDKRIVKCTLCGNYLSMEGVNFGRGDANYCPNCGAKIDADSPKGEDDDNKNL